MDSQGPRRYTAPAGTRGSIPKSWGEMPIEMQVGAYDEWREQHPRWHDLFPAMLPEVEVR